MTEPFLKRAKLNICTVSSALLPALFIQIQFSRFFSSLSLLFIAFQFGIDWYIFVFSTTRLLWDIAFLFNCIVLILYPVLLCKYSGEKIREAILYVSPVNNCLRNVGVVVNDQFTIKLNLKLKNPVE